MTITDQIRAFMRATGVPVSLDQIMDQLAAGTPRNNIATTLLQRCKVGEMSKTVEDGRLMYALVPGYVHDRGAFKGKQAHDGSAAAESSGSPQRKVKPEAHAKNSKRSVPKPMATSRTPVGRELLDRVELANKTLKALEFAANVASDALDLYCAAVADPHVYVPLKQARDQARKALESYTQGGRDG